MLRRCVIAATLPIATLCITVRPSPAAWGPEGVQLHSVPFGTLGVKAVADGQDGAIAVWTDARTGWAALFAQRVTGAGEIAAGWPAGGLRIGEPTSSQHEAAVVAAGDGGAYIAWKEYDTCNVPPCDPSPHLRLLRLAPDGSAAPGWPAGGMEFTSRPATGVLLIAPTLVADGAGGVFVAWTRHDGPEIHEVRAQRFAGDGERLWATSLDGVIVSAGSVGSTVALAPDGVGGLYLAWQDRRRPSHSDILAQHLDALGLPRWTAAGILIAANDIWQLYPSMVPDGLGGALLVWTDYSKGRLLGVPLRPDGPACSPCGTFPLDLDGVSAGAYEFSTDGAGGAVVVWAAGGDIHALRVDGALAAAPGWPATGLAVCTLPGSEQSHPAVAANGADGMTFAWSDTRDRPGVPLTYAVRIGLDGAPVPGWPAVGIPVAPLPFPQLVQGIVPSGGGAIVVWSDDRMDWAPDGQYVPFGTVYAQRIAAPPAVMVPQVALVSVDATAARVRLQWSSPDGVGAAFLLERRRRDGDWTALRWTAADAQGRIVYTDHAVELGAHYDYRLAFFANDGTRHVVGEASVTIPTPLLLRGVSPNPARDVIAVQFALPDDAPATLALYDLAGRLVESHAVGGLGTGAHTMPLAADRRLPAGVYLVRLTRGGRVLTTRASLVN